MLEFIKVIILAIVEGVSEWLPISSSGHLLVLEKFLVLNQREEFKELFFVLVQLGAILAIVFSFIKNIFPIECEKGIIQVNHDRVRLWIKIVIACLPGAIVTILFDDLVENYLHSPFVIAFMLIGYGIIFLFIKEKKNTIKNDVLELSYLDSLKIGAFQCLSLIPGTSRSGATIIGGLNCSLNRKSASEFSFLLAIPVMLGMSLLKMIKLKIDLNINEIYLLGVGMLVSFLVSLLVVKRLLTYLTKHDFKIFGIYRIILGIIIIFIFGFFE